MKFIWLKIAIIAFVIIITLGCKTKIKEQQSQQQKPGDIYQAAMIGDKNSVEEFLKVGVGINDGRNGLTPLHLAAGFGQKEVVQFLIAKGADVNAKINEGYVTPLMNAMMGMGDYKEVAEILISNGADINAQDSIGRTPLHIAVQNGRPDMVELLITKGADVNTKMNDGQTPLDLAMVFSNTKFRYGTPMASQKKDFEECVKLLQQHRTK